MRLGVTAADGGKAKWISLGDGNNQDVYIPRFGWVGSGTVYALVVNRLHTRMDLYFADAASGRSRLVLTESEPNGYLDDERFHITWLKSGDRFLWPSWRDGHMHLYLYSFDKNNPLAADARLERQLTKGEFEVSSVDGGGRIQRHGLFRGQCRRSAPGPRVRGEARRLADAEGYPGSVASIARTSPKTACTSWTTTPR